MARFSINPFRAENLIPAGGAIGEVPPVGKAYRHMALLALPAILEMTLASITSLINTMAVSSLGAGAVAAVGLATQPHLLFMAVFSALGTGIAAVIARRKGEGRMHLANQSLRSTLILCGILSVFLAATAIFTARPMLLFAGAVPGDTLEPSVAYYIALSFSLPLQAVCTVICAAQRSIGNTMLTMRINLLANLINAACNPVFIHGMGTFSGFGIAGAALATGAGWCAGLVYSVFTLVHRHSQQTALCFSRKNTADIQSTLDGTVKVAGSALCEQLLLRFGLFTFARIVASLGTQALSAHQIAYQFLNISFSVGNGIAAAATSVTGRYLGKKRFDLAYMYGQIAFWTGLAAAICTALPIALLRIPLVQLFLPDDNTANAGIAPAAYLLMLIVALIQPLQTPAVAVTGALRGAGDTKHVAYIMLFTAAILRPALAFVLCRTIWNITQNSIAALLGCWVACLTDMLLRLIFSLKRFYGGKWFEIQL